MVICRVVYQYMWLYGHHHLINGLVNKY